MNKKRWTLEEDELLINLYINFTDNVFLNSLIKELNRSKASIACRANELGITKRSRPRSDAMKKRLSESRKICIKENKIMRYNRIFYIFISQVN